MYLFNLNPLPTKANIYLYSWIKSIALKQFQTDQIALLGAEWQLLPPSTDEYAPWVTELIGTPNDNGWNDVVKLCVPSDLVRRVSDSCETPLRLMKKQINTGFQEYRDWLYDTLVNFSLTNPIAAIVTPINCRSLEDVAGYLGIPVIHLEGGAIREPTFKFSSFMLDFRGVNGNSEFDIRYNQSKYAGLTPTLSLSALQNKILSEHYKSYLQAPIEAEYEVGVVLQVEDDSNSVAFSNGWTSLDLIFKARQVFPPELILIRDHPLAHFRLTNPDNMGVIDQSASSIEFIRRCKRILTVNSSVAFEAILLGVPTYILGDSPLRSMAYNTFDRHVREQLKPISDIEERLNFYCFNYIIPRSLWMNQEYFDFRLRKPTEGEIRKRHLEALAAYDL